MRVGNTVHPGRASLSMAWGAPSVVEGSIRVRRGGYVGCRGGCVTWGISPYPTPYSTLRRRGPKAYTVKVQAPRFAKEPVIAARIAEGFAIVVKRPRVVKRRLQKCDNLATVALKAPSNPRTQGLASVSDSDSSPLPAGLLCKAPSRTLESQPEGLDDRPLFRPNLARGRGAQAARHVASALSLPIAARNGKSPVRRLGPLPQVR